MDQERESRLLRLEQAIEAFLARDETVSAADLLAAHPDVADLLAPMLAADGSAEPAAELRGGPPRRLGELAIVREIGRGGMGVVYEAEDPLLKRRVAVKVMPRTAETTASSIVRFRREAELAAGLHHPGVVPVHSLGETDEAFYLVMELERAASLGEVLAELRGSDLAKAPAGLLQAAIARAVARRFPDADGAGPVQDHVPAVVDIVLQIAEALGAAHARGVVHRDVKPGNILVEPGGRAFLTDFGLACVQGDPAVTQAGSVPGTPQYMAPEQVRGERAALTSAADVWALGASLYEALTLQRAFGGDSVPAVLFAVTHRDPVAADRLNPAVPKDLVAIVQKALEKDPAVRYPSAREFAADLAAFRRGEPVGARPVGWLGRVRRRAVREPWRALAAALLLGGVPVVAVLASKALRSDTVAIAGERLLQAEWLDAQLAHGFREAGEGDRDAARECFEAILGRVPGAEEGIAGLSVVARRGGDRQALAVLLGQPQALAASAALRRRQATLLQRLGRDGEAKAAAAGLDEQAVGFDAFLQGYGHLELGHAGSDAEFAVAARLLHRAVVTSDHPRPLYYYEWLHAATHAGDRDAVSAARAAIERLWAGTAASWFWIGFAQDRAGDAAGAIASLERALRIDPAFLAAAINHARLVRLAGRAGEAIERLRALLPSASHPPLVHHELATMLSLGKDYAASLPHYRAALAARPGAVLWRRDYANALAAAGEVAQGIAEIEPVVRALPQDHESRLLLASAYVRQGRNQEARPHLEACLQQKPSAPAFFNLGLVCAGLGDAPGAQRAYEQALELQPGHEQAGTNLALIHLRAGRLADAERLLRRALEAEPAFVPARRALLRVLDQRPADAVAMCREWLQHAPELAEGKRHLAWALLQTGDAGRRAEALALAQAAAAAERDGPTLHVLGAAQLANGEPAAARTTVQQALGLLDPADRFTPFYRQQIEATLQRCEAALAPARGGR